MVPRNKASTQVSTPARPAPSLSPAWPLMIGMMTILSYLFHDQYRHIHPFWWWWWWWWWGGGGWRWWSCCRVCFITNTFALVLRQQSWMQPTSKRSRWMPAAVAAAACSGGECFNTLQHYHGSGVPIISSHPVFTFLEPQSRFGGNPVKFQVVCPQTGLRF